MSDQPGPPCSWCDQRHDVRYLCDPAKAILDALYQRGARGNMPTLEFPDPIPAAQFYGDLGLGPDARVLSQLVVLGCTVPAAGGVIRPGVILTGRDDHDVELPKWLYVANPAGLNAAARLFSDMVGMAKRAAHLGKTV